MCPPPDASLMERLRHGFKNAYYRITAAYCAVILTLIFLARVFGWGG